MSWLSKATGIHIGGNWGVSKTLNKGWNAFGRYVLPIATLSVKDRLQNAMAGDFSGALSGVSKGQIAADAAAAESAARKAAHDAEVQRLADQALGSVSLRRRRGSYATRLTGTSGIASSPTSTGKTLLSQ